MVPCCYDTGWEQVGQCISGGENDGKVESRRYRTAGGEGISNDGEEIQYTATLGDTDCRKNCEYRIYQTRLKSHCVGKSPPPGSPNAGRLTYYPQCQKWDKYTPIDGSGNATGAPCLPAGENYSTSFGACSGHTGYSCDPDIGGLAMETTIDF